MPQDNYVVREKYNGLEEGDGQLVLKRDSVKEELVAVEPDSAEAVRNGGGDEVKRRRRRNTLGEE